MQWKATIRIACGWMSVIVVPIAGVEAFSSVAYQNRLVVAAILSSHLQRVSAEILM